MATTLEVDSRWLTLAGTALLGGGVILGMMLAPASQAPMPTSPPASSMLSTELVEQVRRLAEAGERRASVQPATVREPAPLASDPSSGSDVQRLCEAIYALIESGQAHGASYAAASETVRDIPITNSGAVEAMLTRLRDTEEQRLRGLRGELLMESRAGLLRRLGRPTYVEMSQTGAPVWHYDNGAETLHIDFSTGGYVIGMRRSANNR